MVKFNQIEGKLLDYSTKIQTVMYEDLVPK